MATKSEDVKKISSAHLKRLHDLNAKIRAIIDRVGTLELDIAVLTVQMDELKEESKSNKDTWLNVVKDRSEYANELRSEYGDNISIDQTTGEISNQE
jgi:riboflavin biosynthesis pyrimidine reductase